MTKSIFIYNTMSAGSERDEVELWHVFIKRLNEALNCKKNINSDVVSALYVLSVSIFQ